LRNLFILLVLLLLQNGFAQTMQIGVLTDYKLKKIKINKASGNYHVMADSIYLGLVNSNDIIEVIFVSSGKMMLTIKGNKYSAIRRIYLYPLFEEQSIQFTGINPVFNARQYEGDFVITALKSSMRVVNEVDLETYLEGVIESEAGYTQKYEYYKVQAIISRTYAKKNELKHSTDGYQLCDRVHCQVYHHKRLNNTQIDSAVSATKQQILCLKNGDFAPTFFSANCGGQTCNPSQVWNENIEGLHSFQDTFCIYTKQATWTKSIPLLDWISFLVNDYNFPIDDSLSMQLLYDFKQEERQAFYLHPAYGVPLRDLREEFKLKSTFFNARKEGELMVLNGHGFGHGVGLCQEGAMKMARNSYSFDQIIGFYFPDFTISKIIYK